MHGVDVGQLVLNWLLLGSLYAAIALGFSLVWGIMNIVNLAHGAFVIVGAYATYWAFTKIGLDPFIGILFAMALLFVIGYGVQRVAINRVIRAPLLVTFLLTFGLELLVVDIVQHIFTSDLRSVGTSYAGVGPTIGSTHIALDRVATAVIAVLLTAALSAFLARTRVGNAILATGMDRDAAQLMGINIRHIYALTFGLGAALAGASGAILAQVYPFDPSRGSALTLRAFVVVVLGGLGTPWGVVAGALIFGLAETVVPLVPGIGPGFEDVVAFALLVVVLVIRPNGVLGKAFYS